MGVLQWWNAISLPPSSSQTLEETAGLSWVPGLVKVPLRGSVLQLEGHELVKPGTDLSSALCHSLSDSGEVN